MNKIITPTGKMITLVRREFWEQRISFLLVPFSCIALAVIALAVSVIQAYFNDYSILANLANPSIDPMTAAERMVDFAAAPIEVREHFWDMFYMSSTSLLFLVFWGIMIYYFLATLYQQRKDRSILFWNSMPVSDTLTILSKLLAGLVIAYAVFLLSMLAMQLLMMVILSIYGLLFDVEIWSTFIAPANIFYRFACNVVFGIVNIFWCLPVYAWLLLCSAWAKSAPLAWAAGPLIICVVPELIIYERSDILLVFFQHMIPMWMFENSETGFSGILSQVMNGELLLAAIVGVGLVYAAIRLNRSEDV